MSKEANLEPVLVKAPAPRTAMMRAHLLVKPGHLEFREVAIPDPGPRGILVRIKTALTCGTDLKTYRRGHPKMPLPALFGHEFAGEIAAVGKEVRGFHAGDAIMAAISAPCDRCYYCQRGLENLCDTIMDTKIGGAFAEYIVVPDHIVRRNLFLKPKNLSYEEAALLEPFSCVVHGMDQVAVRPDDTVLIIGAGAIGLMHVMLCRHLGPEQLIVAGRRAGRLRIARELGANAVIDDFEEDVRARVMELTGGRGANIVIECTGDPLVWENSTHLVARGGTVIFFGGCPAGTTVAFDTQKLHYDQITLKGIFHFTPAAVRRAFHLLESKALDMRPLISGRHPLKDVPRLIERLLAGDGIKYAIVP